MYGITWAFCRLRALMYTFDFTPSVNTSTFLSLTPSFANNASIALVLGVWCVVGLVLCLATFRWTNRRDS